MKSLILCTLFLATLFGAASILLLGVPAIEHTPAILLVALFAALGALVGAACFIAGQGSAQITMVQTISKTTSANRQLRTSVGA